RRHRDEIALLAVRGGDDLLCRLAPGDDAVDVDAVRGELATDDLEIVPVLPYLLGFTQRQLVHVARGESVRDMNQHHGRATQLREAADVLQDRLVVGRVFQGHHDARV